MELITSISTAIDIVKKLRDLNQKISEADFKMLLADLTSELGDAKLQAGQLKIELATANERIAELERTSSRAAQNDPELHEGAYVFGDTSRHYCTGCFDQTGRRILLTEHTRDFQVFGKWFCPSCKNNFGPGR